MKKYLATLAMLVASIAPGLSTAADITASMCNGCTMQQRSQSAIGQGGTGIRYVADLQNETLYRYEVEAEPGINGTSIYWAFDVGGVAPEHQQFVASLGWLYKSHGNSLSNPLVGAVQASSLGGYTAYDVVFSGPLRNTVIDFVRNQNNWSSWDLAAWHIQTAINTGSSVFITGNVVLTVIEVQFADGSRADFEYDHTTKQWSFIDGSAVDKNNNPIPSGNPPAGQTWTYNYENNQPLLDWLQNLGWELWVSSSCSVLACTSNGTGETVCEVVSC